MVVDLVVYNGKRALIPVQWGSRRAGIRYWRGRTVDEARLIVGAPTTAQAFLGMVASNLPDGIVWYRVSHNEHLTVDTRVKFE